MIFNLFLALQLPLLIRGAEVSGKDKSEVAGVLLLDSSTFPVLVQNLGPQSRMLVGIFDKRQTVVQDPPTLEGDVRHKFINFAQAYGRDETADVSNLLFAQIIVNGGGNRFLKNRLVGEGRELPIFVVFGENKTDPAVIDLDLRDYRYCTFISILNEYAGYSNKLPGVLPQFAPLVKTFVAGDRTVRSQVFKEAKELYDSISDKRIIGDADYYIKVMDKLMEQGAQYLKEYGGSLMSRARLPMVTDDRSYKLDKQLNILDEFLKEFTSEPIREAGLPYLKTKDELSYMQASEL